MIEIDERNKTLVISDEGDDLYGEWATSDYLPRFRVFESGTVDCVIDDKTGSSIKDLSLAIKISKDLSLASYDGSRPRVPLENTYRYVYGLFSPLDGSPRFILFSNIDRNEVCFVVDALLHRVVAISDGGFLIKVKSESFGVAEAFGIIGKLNIEQEIETYLSSSAQAEEDFEGEEALSEPGIDEKGELNLSQGENEKVYFEKMLMAKGHLMALLTSKFDERTLIVDALRKIDKLTHPNNENYNPKSLKNCEDYLFVTEHFVNEDWIPLIGYFTKGFVPSRAILAYKFDRRLFITVDIVKQEVMRSSCQGLCYRDADGKEFFGENLITLLGYQLSGNEIKGVLSETPNWMSKPKDYRDSEFSSPNIGVTALKKLEKTSVEIAPSSEPIQKRIERYDLASFDFHGDAQVLFKVKEGYNDRIFEKANELLSKYSGKAGIDVNTLWTVPSHLKKSVLALDKASSFDVDAWIPIAVIKFDIDGIYAAFYADPSFAYRVVGVNPKRGICVLTESGVNCKDGAGVLEYEDIVALNGYKIEDNKLTKVKDIAAGKAFGPQERAKVRETNKNKSLIDGSFNVYDVLTGSNNSLVWYCSADEEEKAALDLAFERLLQKTLFKKTSKTICYPGSLLNSQIGMSRFLKPDLQDEWLLLGASIDGAGYANKAILVNKKKANLAMAVAVSDGALIVASQRGISASGEEGDYSEKEMLSSFGLTYNDDLVIVPFGNLPSEEEITDINSSAVQNENPVPSFAKKEVVLIDESFNLEDLIRDGGRIVYVYEEDSDICFKAAKLTGSKNSYYKTEGTKFIQGKSKDDDRLFFDLANFRLDRYFLMGAIVSGPSYIVASILIEKEHVNNVVVVFPKRGEVRFVSHRGCYVRQYQNQWTMKELLSYCGLDYDKNFKLVDLQVEEDAVVEEKIEEYTPEIIREEETIETVPEEITSDTIIEDSGVVGEVKKVEQESKESDYVEPEDDDETIFNFENSDKIKPIRRVYCTRLYQKAIKEIVKGQPSYKRKINGIHRALLTLEQNDLQEYLHHKDNKDIEGSYDRYKIRKFRIGENVGIKGRRIFYIQGKDCGRGLDRESIVLLYVSEISEHDAQGKIVRNLEDNMEKTLRKIITGEAESPMIDGEIYDIRFSEETVPEAPTFSEYPVVSKKQGEMLRKNPPLIIKGSAGTGKTTLSIKQYEDYINDYPDAKIAYVTFMDSLKENVRKATREMGLPDNCHTFSSLCSSALSLPMGSFVDQKDFDHWIKRQDRNKDVKKALGKIDPDPFMASDIAYVFFRGVYEGSSKRKGAYRYLDKETFLDEIKDEMGLADVAKESIYFLCDRYGKRLKENKLLTDNEASLKIISLYKKGELEDRKYDCLIIDEAQDFTELQIKALASLLKKEKTSLFFFGDDNQAINPTLMKLGSIAALVQEVTDIRADSVDSEQLGEAYRSSKFMISHINNLIKKRKRSIGANNQAADQDEHSSRQDEEGVPPNICYEKKTIDAIISDPDTYRKADVVVLCPDSRTKEEAKSLYPKDGPDKDNLDDIFITIREAKGREWDEAILFNFISSGQKTWERMLNGIEGHKSTIHRMMFNRYYVALTRARDRVVIAESGVNDFLKKELFSDMEVQNDKEKLSSYLDAGYSDYDWMSEAVRLKNSRHFKNAIRCLNRIPEEKRDKAWKDLYDLNVWYKTAIEKVESGANQIDPSELKPIYKKAIELRDYRLLKDFYRGRGMDEKITILDSVDKKTDVKETSKLLGLYKNIENKCFKEEKDLFCRILAAHYKETIESLLKQGE
ncbi:MAG: AAA family ATPase [Bacilli bacterium]|nr:AAA family ATPase [Bacilli bacterium]